MLDFSEQMDRLEHQAKASELIELFKAWNIVPGDAIAIADAMKAQTLASKSWVDPLQGTGRKADPWRS
jgi:hypothetical protein